MRRNQILTTKQEKVLNELAVKKLTELAQLPERKNLLQEIELASIKHEEVIGIYVKDRILILTRHSFIDQEYISDPNQSEFKRFFSDKRITKNNIVSEEDFEKIVEDYKLEAIELQNLINNLKQIPSVNSVAV